MINLILACVWFTTAVCLYWLNPEKRGILSFSSAAFILGVFNVIRWWMTRVARSQRDQDEMGLPRRRLHRASDDLPAPDPNFVFTDPPPSPPQPQSPAPPGTNGTGPENKGTGFSS